MITQNKILLMTFQMLVKGKLFGDMTPGELLKLVMYFHDKGWLHIAFEEDKLSTVVGMYRVKETYDGMDEKVPEKEEGNILYVRFAVSFARDKQLIKKLVTNYMKKHNIKEVSFNELKKGDKLKSLHLRGDNDGKEQSRTTRNATVSNRS